MAIRRLRLEPDEILHKPCRKVGTVDDRIRELLDDLADTLRGTDNGAGLAAPQVGILKRLVVIDMGRGLQKLVNPEIIASEGERECVEGCLSVPDVWGRTTRPQKVTVRAFDENGREVLLIGEDEVAKCYCHEIDHLDGVLFTSLAHELYRAPED